MKKIIYIFLLMGLGLNAQSTAKLLFSTGFEGVSLIQDNDVYKHFSGTDSETGFTHPMVLGGSTWERIQHAGGIGDINISRLETVTGHLGNQTQAFYREVTKTTEDYVYQIPHQLTGMTASDQKFYVKMWMKVGATTFTGKNKWRVIWEYKTPDYDVAPEIGFRVAAYMNMDSNGNEQWDLRGDDAPGNSGTVYWKSSRTDIPFPKDEWFKLEYFVDFVADGSATGRVWMKINDQLIADMTNVKTSMHSGDPMGTLFTSTVYAANGGHQWVDDMEIWDDVPDAPIINVTSVSITETAAVNVGATSQLTATVLPSTASNKYGYWTSNDETVATVDEGGLVTGVRSGTATITFTTDDGGYTDTSAITVNQSTDSVTANAGSDVSICEGESTTLNASGGTSYSWNTGETASSITVDPSSTQTYAVTVSDSYGNTDTDDVIITVNSVTANAGSDVTIDEGDSVTLTASGGDSYLWNTGATGSSITVSPTSSRNYTVTASSNGCDDTDTVRVDVNQSTGSVRANAGSDVSICTGESTTLNATGGTSYSWSNGTTKSSISVSPSSTQTYTVTVSDSNGNSDTDDVIVTVNSVTANAGSDVTIDESDSVTLTASGGDSYIWNTGATTSSITVSPTSSRNYTVTASSNGCDDTDIVRINVNQSTGSVTANAGLDVSICNGESTTLTASGGSDYLWNTGETTSSITVSPLSTQTYKVTVSDSNGNSDTDDVLVTVNSVTASAGSNRSIMEGESITLVATGGDSYIWNTGEKSNSINVSPSSTRTYSVTAYKGSCQDIDEIVINVELTVGTGPLPAEADAGEDMTICLGESIVLNGSGGETYQWSNGETLSSISVSPNRTTTYELAATRGGVTNLDFVTITVENCEDEIVSDEEDLAILDMAVYPNPTHGEITIRINNLDEDANFIINDTKGSLIYSEYISGQKRQFDKQIDLSRYSNGLYFVRLFSAEQYLVKKVMVQ